MSWTGLGSCLSAAVAFPATTRAPCRTSCVRMNKTKVLLILTQDVLDGARVLAGKATAALKLPVSLQIVLRALIEVGLKQKDRPVLLANIEDQAKAVRLKRARRHEQG